MPDPEAGGNGEDGQNGEARGGDPQRSLRVPAVLGLSSRPHPDMAQLFRNPGVELDGVGEDAGARRPVKAVDRESELDLPALARFNRPPQVRRDLFPRFETRMPFHTFPPKQGYGF